MRRVSIICLFLVLVSHTFARPPQSAPGLELPTRKERKNDRQKNTVVRVAEALINYHDFRLLNRTHRINIVPIAYWFTKVGWNLGVHMIIRPPENSPQRYRLLVQGLSSSRGSQKHRAEFTYRNIAGSRFGVRVRADWERDILSRYFGLGNNSRRDDAFLDKNSPEFIDNDYYLYNLKRPRGLLVGSYEISSNLEASFGLGFEVVRPQLKKGVATSFLGLDQPFGYLGGSGLHLSFRLVRDTRHNSRVFPEKRSSLSEFSYEPNWASVRVPGGTAGAPKSDRRVIFHRLTVSHAQFFPLLAGKTVLALRGTFETLAGATPYYEMGEFATGSINRALGGSQSLRGYKASRFQDKVKLLTTAELRFNVRQFKMFATTFRPLLTAYVDAGRVWHQASDFAPRDFHSTYGFGAWLHWGRSKVIRFDVGHSPEGFTPYFQLRTSF